MITIQDKIDLVTEAQGKLLDAIELLEEAELGANLQAYLIDHLKIYATADHGFLDGSPNCSTVIEGLEKELTGIAECEYCGEEFEKNTRATGCCSDECEKEVAN